MAASSRSAALAYRIGSLRHDSRYSAIDMSVSLRTSKDRAKALNRESAYMIPLLKLLERAAKSDGRPNRSSDCRNPLGSRGINYAATSCLAGDVQKSLGGYLM